jgi:ornithine carbamoyltransferase/carbamoyltransferase
VDGPKLTVPALTPAHGPARNVISVLDLDRSTVAAIVRRAGDFFTALDDHSHPLAGKVVGTLFEKTSTRTRTAFLVGAIRLGAQVVTYGPNDLQTNTGESLEDTGRILGLMLDGLVARCARPVADVRLMARHAGIPVVSAMAVEEHPTQGLCDAAMLALAAGGYQNLKGLRLLYVGEGNNTAVALAYVLSSVLGAHLTFATPVGHGLPAAAAAAATARSRKNDGEFVEFHDPADAAGPFDVVYATRWQTTGTTKTNPDWRLRFHGFRVDSVLMDRWPGSLFMHDLPAHRGEDVDSDVLDGARSLAWAQARMKLCSAMAVLEYAMA